MKCSGEASGAHEQRRLLSREKRWKPKLLQLVRVTDETQPSVHGSVRVAPSCLILTVQFIFVFSDISWHAQSPDVVFSGLMLTYARSQRRLPL